MTLFDDINQLSQAIENNRKNLDLRGISLGKVCFVSNLGLIKVIDLNSQQNYVTNWLRPVQTIKQIHINDYVLYSYPTYDLSMGIYFQVFSSEHDSPVDPGSGVTIEQVNQAIDTALAEYDILIKQWVLDRNYTTLANVQTWVNAQGFTNLTTVQNWVNSQNFTTQSELSQGLADERNWVVSQDYATRSWVDDTFTRFNEVTNPLSVWRYGVNYFFQGSKGNNAQLSDQYADRHITLMTLGSRLPSTGGVQDAAPEIGLTLDGGASGLEQRFDIGTEIFLRVNTTARIHIKWFNNITVNGVNNSATTANVGTLMPLRTAWKLNKTALRTWTLIDLNNFNYIPFI